MKIKGTLPARQSVAEYLVEVDAAQRVTVARRLGWVEIDNQQFFVLSDETIGAELGEQVVLEQNLNAPHARRGTLENWRGALAMPAGGHLMARFAISTSLSGPLLHLGGLESGLMHLWGPSSVGKTTLLRIAASVWGSGADGGYVRAWRSTANALEGTLAGACDTFLPLDEIGQADGREIGKVVYMIAGAIGKQRMARDTSIKPSYKWRVLALSSGETTIAAQIGEEQKVKRAHAGQLVRAIDIPSQRELGVFDQAYTDFDPQAFADEMKRAASTYYGVAGPEFVRALIERQIGGGRIHTLVDEFVADALDGINADHGQVARVAVRFGLVAAAGELAAEFGIVSWPVGRTRADALELFKAWLAARGGAAPAEIKQMIEQVRVFIEAHGNSRFDDLDPPPRRSAFSEGPPERPPVRDRAGYRKGEGEERRWYVLPEVWRKEICAGFDPREVTKNLAKLNMLELGESGKQSQVVRISKMTQRVYVLTPAIFEGWGK